MYANPVLPVAFNLCRAKQIAKSAYLGSTVLVLEARRAFSAVLARTESNLLLRHRLFANLARPGSINRQLAQLFVCFVPLEPAVRQLQRQALMFACSVQKGLTRILSDPPHANFVIPALTAQL
jgi:hypothetical protein